MKDLFKPLVVASIAVLLAGVGGCSEEGGNNNAANAKLERMQKALTTAQQDAEKALTRNTVLQSRLKALESGAPVAAVAAVVAETAVVETVVAESPVPATAAAAAGSGESAAVKKELATVLAERDHLHALLEDNEEALRDGLAESAQQQHLMAGMEEQLAATRQVAEAAADRLTQAEEQIKVLHGDISGGQQDSQASVAQMASLQEQLVAMQADKVALETLLTTQDKQMQVAGGATEQAKGKIATLEQSLAAARGHGNTLAEQLAAIQADTQKLEAQLLDSANRLQAAEVRRQTVVAEVVAAADDDPAAAVAVLKVELAAARDEDARLRDRANLAEQRGVDLEQQLSGALSQAKVLQQEVAGLRHARDELELEMRAVESSVVASASAVSVDSSALNVSDAVEIQALLEEGQVLLEACNSSLGSGAEQMFELEQQSIGMRNALQRQRRVTASRCGRMSGALKSALDQNRRMRAMLNSLLAR